MARAGKVVRACANIAGACGERTAALRGGRQGVRGAQRGDGRHPRIDSGRLMKLKIKECCPFSRRLKPWSKRPLCNPFVLAWSSEWQRAAAAPDKRGGCRVAGARGLRCCKKRPFGFW
jgi:hypothetical protein